MNILFLSTVTLQQIHFDEKQAKTAKKAFNRPAKMRGGIYST
jgi:hypothetical protein